MLPGYVGSRVTGHPEDRVEALRRGRAKGCCGPVAKKGLARVHAIWTPRAEAVWPERSDLGFSAMHRVVRAAQGAKASTGGHGSSYT